jgi:hypothetical protein
MPVTLKYINAIPGDFKLLTDTAIASKQYWGYSDEVIRLLRPDLEVTEEYILRNEAVKVFEGSAFIGFYSLKLLENGVMEIDNLWLTVDNIKKGYGRLIFVQILKHLKTIGHAKATLIAEPNAKGFYDKMGGKVISRFESKIKGRFLDVYEFVV